MTVTTLYFTLDQLDSIAVITNSAGAVIERDSYDAWGRQRNPNGTDNGTCYITSLTTRGFTNQEEMNPVCALNLNARIYDSTLGRMISADSIVPDPTDGQSYNRYSYVENGPLSETDPTGHGNYNCAVLACSDITYFTGTGGINDACLNISQCAVLILTPPTSTPEDQIKDPTQSNPQSCQGKDCGYDSGGRVYLAAAHVVPTPIPWHWIPDPSMDGGGYWSPFGPSPPEQVIVTAPRREPDKGWEFTIHLSDAALALRSGQRLYEEGKFLYRGKTYSLNRRGPYKFRLAKLNAGAVGRIAAYAGKGLAVVSISMNVIEAYDAGFSQRADVRLVVGAGLGIAALAIAGPEIAVVALVYSAVDLAGGWNWAYNNLDNTPLVNTGSPSEGP